MIRDENVSYLQKRSIITSFYNIHLMSALEIVCFVRDEVEGNIEIRGKTKLTMSRGNRHLFCL
jgi:hypothetical protein